MVVGIFGRLSRRDIVIVIILFWIELRRIDRLFRLHLFYGETRVVMNGIPVIVGCRFVAFHYVPVEIPYRRPVQCLSFPRSRHFNEITIVWRAGTRLIIVTHKVALMTALASSLVLSAIAGVFLPPIVIHIVEKLHEYIAVASGIAGTIQASAAVKVVCHQVVVICGRRPTPLIGVTAVTFCMPGIIQAFVYDTPLNGGKMIIIHGHVLFPTPSKAAMVNNDVVGIFYSQPCAGNESVRLIESHATTDVTDDNIL